MTSTHTGEAVVALGEAVAELGGALRRDAEATVEGVSSITVGQMVNSVVGAGSGVLVRWGSSVLAFKKMELRICSGFWMKSVTEEDPGVEPGKKLTGGDGKT